MKFPPARGNTGNGGNEKEETIMISQVITKIQNDLSRILDENQMKCLLEVLQKHLSQFEEIENCFPSLWLQSVSRDAQKNLYVIMNLQSGICWKASVSQNVK